MSFLDKIEKRMGRFYIHGLTNKILGIKLITAIMLLFYPKALAFFNESLIFESRLFTNLFIAIATPPTIPSAHSQLSPLWLIFGLYILHMTGNNLQSVWGEKRFNLFIASYLIIYVTVLQLTQQRAFGSDLIYLNCFLAFAILFPNVEFLIFFILPVKVRYLGIIAAIFYLISALGLAFYPYQLVLYAGISPVILFFGPMLFRRFYHQKRNREFTKKLNKFQQQASFHRCAECGITEKESPSLEFRISSVDGNDYCINHLPKK